MRRGGQRLDQDDKPDRIGFHDTRPARVCRKCAGTKIGSKEAGLFFWQVIEIDAYLENLIARRSYEVGTIGSHGHVRTRRRENSR
jgi:hypothetical protein